ncbi:alpha/beta hydrolase [Acuticoccus mangrovi]|uniref:Alpha/beta fold hydrolase n=1 Tax=Acuticoccus mangrovi TaxID=2796142 RepID=A0A934MKW1_9HYPH|nr:alpha/beta fold hydrolase [Acuticoccus mangrovi]MBJ3775799.1 alpha/beta fold hydrolase [Acuticoccus mangrovi]
MAARRLRRLGRGILATLAVLAVLIVAVLAAGTLYTWNAERTHRHHNAFTADGIIVKAGTREVTRGARHLVVLVHGFSASPMTMAPFLEAFRGTTDVDVWAPLLAFHGRSLADFRRFDPATIRDDLAARLAERAEGYDEVTIIAHSFGGAVVADLLARRALPEGARVILFAPALHIPANTRANRLSLEAFRLFASYCDIAPIGCRVPDPDPGADDATRAAQYAQTIFFYLVPDAVLALFDYADVLAPMTAAITAPIDIVMAKDDRSVDYAMTAQMCAAMRACTMHALPKGGHLAQLGPEGPALSALLVALATGAGVAN